MDQVAADTGGKAFYNTGGLKEAVESAIGIGSNYYTLPIRPRNTIGTANSARSRSRLISPARASLIARDTTPTTQRRRCTAKRCCRSLQCREP